MTHVGEEFAFGLVGCFGGVACFGQLLGSANDSFFKFVVGLRKRVFRMLDLIEHSIERLEQNSNFSASVASHAERVVVFVRNPPGHFSQRQQRVRNSTLHKNREEHRREQRHEHGGRDDPAILSDLSMETFTTCLQIDRADDLVGDNHRLDQLQAAIFDKPISCRVIAAEVVRQTQHSPTSGLVDRLSVAVRNRRIGSKNLTLRIDHHSDADVGLSTE